MKALVVDDQPNVRLLLSQILRRTAGCTVTEVCNGLEALDLLGRHRFDFVVLDVMMPLMDGIETLEAIRQSPAIRHLPVVVLSAVRDEAKVRQLVRLGISGYLAKPLRPLDVAERLQGILSRLSAGAAPPVRAESGPDRGARVLAARAELRPQMVSATEQVFGMMLGLEVLAVGSDQRPSAGDDVARVALRLEVEECDLELAIIAPRAASERMTAQYLKAGDVVADADVSATLGEMVAIIGSRLQSALRQRGDDVVVTPPMVSVLGSAIDAAPAGMSVCFVSSTQDVRFTTTLRAVPAPRRQPPAPVQPARNSYMDSPLPPAVDPEVIEMLASLQEPGEPDLVVELVTLFLRDTPDRLRELEGRPLDPARTARVAHSVKGSAGNLGASHLQELASRLEHAGHVAQPGAELARLADALCTEYVRVEQYLRGVLAERAGPDGARGV